MEIKDQVLKVQDDLNRLLYGSVIDEPEFDDLVGENLAHEIAEAFRALQKLLCRVTDHYVMDDQCGIPAHRYCLYCECGTPNCETQESRRPDLSTS